MTVQSPPTPPRRLDGADAAAAAQPSPNGRAFSVLYLATIGGTSIAFLCAFWLVLFVINRLGVEPPPQLSNNLCIDQKLAYLRTHSIANPTILAVGSSVTWRNFDSMAIQQASGGQSVPFNGAFCGLKINQTKFTTDYFIERIPSIHQVMTILAPEDLTGCDTTNPRVFDPEDADKFVYRRAWTFPLYLKYFDPVTLIKNVFLLRRSGLESLTFDRYADGPLDTSETRGLTYGELPPLDPSCLRSLRQLAQELDAKGLRFVVVTMPLNPEWKARFDPKGTVMRQASRQIESALAGTSATFWDADHDFAMNRGAFIDAIHIRWSAAKVFSRALVVATGLGVGMEPLPTE